MTSVQAVRRRIAPTGAPRLPHAERDERARLYQIGRALVERLRRAFAITDTHLELLCSEPTARVAGPGAHHR
ncbi:hypothetical protein AB0D24_13250 [Streptomyces javensis]|uniref:hypothetical protein n=1 Tax=Streptomyces javensis TaxID=114698 RepID=UPI0033DC1B5C